jgi:hypothetical protein
MNPTLQKRWLFDAALFTAFLTCFFLDLTGIALHQWLGLAAGAAAAYHLLAHTSWVKTVTARFFGKTSTQARYYFLIDAVLLAGFAGMVTTGLVISTWLDLSLASYATWRAVHILASVATLLVLTLKIGLHSRWISMVGRRIFYGPDTAQPASGQANPLKANRRSALKLMGVVGTASLIAVSSSLKGLSSQSSSTVQASNVSTSTVSLANSAEICPLRCGRRCSYPGRCRRYTDSNKNGRSDLGECQS